MWNQDLKFFYPNLNVVFMCANIKFAQNEKKKKKEMLLILCPEATVVFIVKT